MSKMMIWFTAIIAASVFMGCEKKAKNEEMPSPAEMVEGTVPETPEESLTIAEEQKGEMAQVSENTSATAENTMASDTAGEAAPSAGPTGKFENISIADIQKAVKNANLYMGTVDGVNGA